MITKNVELNVLNYEAARSTAKLVQIATQYHSKVNIVQEGKTVNAKSIMGMMTLGLTPGKILGLTVDGDDEEAAMDDMVAFLSGQ